MKAGRRAFVKAAGAAATGAACASFTGCASVGKLKNSGPRIATFECDATPPLGGTLIWTVKLERIEDRLRLKGIVLEEDGKRSVLCALDWCLLCNESERAFRETLARATGTEPDRVAIHCVHQHTAPYADEDAHRLLDAAPEAPPRLTEAFLGDLHRRMGKAVADATARLEPFGHVGCGTAAVERVASHRRLKGVDGKIVVRYSVGSEVQRAMPEGDIDPLLRTISFARDGRTLARLHYYATHPQTHSCDGSASADFVGAARQALEREEGVFQVYFTGCAGDVTVGKYNSGAPAEREALALRLLAGMKASAAATRYAPAGHLIWRTEKLVLPVRTDAPFTTSARARLNDPKAAAGQRVYGGAMQLASAARAARPFKLSALQIGDIHIVHLPGEPMLEYQRFVQSCLSGGFATVAGYGDCGTGYVCSDTAFDEGGYEPTATYLSPGAEPVLKDAIRRLLGV